MFRGKNRLGRYGIVFGALLGACGGEPGVSGSDNAPTETGSIVFAITTEQCKGWVDAKGELEFGKITVDMEQKHNGAKYNASVTVKEILVACEPNIVAGVDTKLLIRDAVWSGEYTVTSRLFQGKDVNGETKFGLLSEDIDEIFIAAYSTEELNVVFFRGMAKVVGRFGLDGIGWGKK